MDLLPKPDQVVAAAGNVAHKVLYGGVADLRKMPRTLIDEGLLRQVYHYRPTPTAPEDGDPVLLVTPLAAPSSCYDLRRGCSLVEHLINAGHRTYLLEYGEVSFRDRNLGMEHWIEEVVPEAIRHVSQHAGGRPVHVVGWSLGGIFMTLAAADHDDLPIASLTIVGSPFDVSKVPMIAPLRPLLKFTDGTWGGVKAGDGPVTRVYRALGGAPKPLVRWAFQLTAAQKLLTKPIVKLQQLDNTEFLAQIEAVDAFTAAMIAYPGRTFGQLYHRFVKKNELVRGYLSLGEKRVELKDVTAPVLVFAGETDGIAPIEAVRAVVGHLTSAPEVRFEVVPGGHLGMLTGRAARNTTWLILEEWLNRWASDATPEPNDPASPPAEAPRDPKGIGANPKRRYGSDGSRSLAP
ncbi:alpha/beta fold hydrolase [Nocardioides sp. Bht2]|uniref:alpha/beta fold hydrolase n=1 Tax=Nocardioides sp. Bht2 TaxID=3392297 RepID=UPI0039B5D256